MTDQNTQIRNKWMNQRVKKKNRKKRIKHTARHLNTRLHSTNTSTIFSYCNEANENKRNQRVTQSKCNYNLCNNVKKNQMNTDEKKDIIIATKTNIIPVWICYLCSYKNIQRKMFCTICNATYDQSNISTTYDSTNISCHKTTFSLGDCIKIRKPKKSNVSKRKKNFKNNKFNASDDETFWEDGKKAHEIWIRPIINSIRYTNNRIMKQQSDNRQVFVFSKKYGRIPIITFYLLHHKYKHLFDNIIPSNTAHNNYKQAIFAAHPDKIESFAFRMKSENSQKFIYKLCWIGYQICNNWSINKATMNSKISKDDYNKMTICFGNDKLVSGYLRQLHIQPPKDIINLCLLFVNSFNNVETLAIYPHYFSCLQSIEYFHIDRRERYCQVERYVNYSWRHDTHTWDYDIEYEYKIDGLSNKYLKKEWSKCLCLIRMTKQKAANAVNEDYKGHTTWYNVLPLYIKTDNSLY